MLEQPLCPKCKSSQQVLPKMLLIGEKSPKLLFGEEEKAGYQRRDQLAVDECKVERLRAKPLQQFVDGYFCAQCEKGFVSKDILIGQEIDCP